MTIRLVSLLLLLAVAIMATVLLAGCGRRNTPAPDRIPMSAQDLAATVVVANAADETQATPMASSGAAASAATAAPTTAPPPPESTSVPLSGVGSIAPPAPLNETPVMALNEKIVTVGPTMVDCPDEGAGGGRCYLVKEEGDADWTVFPGKIEGFEYWPEAEYVMIVREDRIANPPAGAPAVIWTIIRGLYKINVPATPTAAP